MDNNILFLIALLGLAYAITLMLSDYADEAPLYVSGGTFAVTLAIVVFTIQNNPEGWGLQEQLDMIYRAVRVFIYD